MLVVKDTFNGGSSIPGVLGMNIIKECYWELFVQHGPALLNIPSVLQAPNSIETNAPTEHSGHVRVKGRRVCRVPGGTMKMVVATGPQHLQDQILFEPLSSGLPAGLLASPSLVNMSRGTVYIPIVNVGAQEVVLYPNTILGNVSESYLVHSPDYLIEKGVAATVFSQTAGLVQDKIEAIDLTALTPDEQREVRALLQKYRGIFSAFEGDLCCTNLISHDIPLTDDVPVRQRYRCIPPSEYEAAKAHICQLLEAQVIRESSSPFASPIVLVKKKDGSLHLCVDYRLLISKTRKDAFPLPRIEESLDALSGDHWFCTLDLAAGYNQVPVTEGDNAKTAFCTP